MTAFRVFTAMGDLRFLQSGNGDHLRENLSFVTRNRWADIHFIGHGKQTRMFNEHVELLITELSPEGLTIISRAGLIEPTTGQLNRS
jgi:hypothetical protein